MRIPPFELERIQSLWEHVVDYNLSESGVDPLSLAELLDGDAAALARLSETRLGYTQTNGSLGLRERVAALYPGATPANVLITSGTSEANFVALLGLVEPGDEVAVMLPNYMQIWGLGHGFRGEVRPFYLRADEKWAVDLDELRREVTPRTRVIAVCNPNNPTGAVLSAEEMEAIVEVASGVGAWLIADEVYRGAEREGEETPSFWTHGGGYERMIITCGLSKAYGLPGLRVGWVVAPAEMAEHLWSYRDYTTIAPSALSDALAHVALEGERRERILNRTRSILRANYPIVERWMESLDGLLETVPPQAGAIALVRYRLPIDSIELVERMRREQGVLVVPGAHFGLEGYLRIGYGGRAEHLREGLERMGRVLGGQAAAIDKV